MCDTFRESCDAIIISVPRKQLNGHDKNLSDGRKMYNIILLCPLDRKSIGNVRLMRNRTFVSVFLSVFMKFSILKWPAL